MSKEHTLKDSPLKARAHLMTRDTSLQLPGHTRHTRASVLLVQTGFCLRLGEGLSAPAPMWPPPTHLHPCPTPEPPR